MISKEKITEIIKATWPQGEAAVIESMTYSIVHDAEAKIYAMIRQAINQERESLYWKNNK